MSKGLQVVGTFNPNNEDAVTRIKQKAVELIDLIEELGKCPRRKSIAITDVEKAQMMAVKSLFH